MTEFGDQRSQTIHAMAFRVRDQLGGFRRPSDHELIAHLMTTTYDQGFKLEQLVEHLHRRIRAYGFFRDKSHIVSVVRALSLNAGLDPSRLAITVTTTGELAGYWVFLRDGADDLLLSRDGRPCAEVGSLEGLDLMTAVVESALTEPLEQPKKRFFRRR